MIEVRLDETGDWAEAETAEAAILAARTLIADRHAAPGASYYQTSHVSFFNSEGRAIALGLRPDDLNGER